MLTNFFALNIPEDYELKRIKSATQLKDELRHSTGLSDVIYEPESLSYEELQPLSNHFSQKKFENVSFRRTTISNIIFNDCQFVDCLFSSTRFVNCEFHNCKFSGCNPYKIEFENTYIDPSIFVGMIGDTVEHSNIGMHLFQQLYHNSTSMNQWEFADTAEYNRKQWMRYILNYKRRKKEIGMAEYCWRWSKNYLFYWLMGYGVRFRFIALWASVFIISSLVLNYTLWSHLEIAGKNGSIESRSFVSVLYYTATIPSGLGEFTPTSEIGRLIFLLEAFFAVIIGSFLVTWLAKRTVR